MIYITGDLHGQYDIKKLAPKNFEDGQNLTKDDYLIIAGDFGLIFENEMSSREIFLLDWLNEQPWTTLFIDGNHENFIRLKEYNTEKWNGGDVSFIKDSIIWLHRGQVFNINNKKFLTLGGGTSIDKNLRTAYVSWWPDENISYEDYLLTVKNIEEHKHIDFVITHAAPTEFAKELFERFKLSYYNDVNSNTLEQIKCYLNDYGYNHWFFGHYHLDLKTPKFTALYDRIIRID